MLVVLIGMPIALATAVIVLLPSINGTDTENAPALEGVAMPFTVIVAFGSLTVPFTVMGLVLMKLRLTGSAMAIFGGNNTVSFDVLLFPAASTATTPIEFAPGVRDTTQLTVAPVTVAGLPLQATLATPDNVSVT